MWDYEGCGFGLTIYAPNGETLWLQGDEAADLEDQLEACVSEEDQQRLLDQYSVLLEG